MCHDSKYASLHRFLRKCCTVDAWQDSECSLGSDYDRVLNRPGLHKRAIIDIWQSSEDASKLLNDRVTESCEFFANFILEIQGILNMRHVLNIPRFSMYQES